MFISNYLKNLYPKHKSNYSDKINIENIKVIVNMVKFHCFSFKGAIHYLHTAKLRIKR